MSIKLEKKLKSNKKIAFLISYIYIYIDLNVKYTSHFHCHVI